MNAYALENKFKEALEQYEKAINADTKVAIYYSNAAACHSRLGNHEAALKTINEAISLDPTFMKAYYRRGLALMELKQFKEASEDFIKVCREFPADLAAQKRLQDCDRELNKKASFEESLKAGFASAIRVERFELTRKCIDALTVDATYDGPVVDWDHPITADWVQDTLIPHFAADKKLNAKYAYMVIMSKCPPFF